MSILSCVLLAMLGAVMGSFVMCQAWRLRYEELGREKLGNRSVCLSCKKQLKWYDNIPIISWLVLRGRCRHCHKKIGTSEIFAELASMFIFLHIGALFYRNVPVMNMSHWFVLVLLLILSCFLVFLGIYDGKWGELPDFALWCSVVLAIAIFGIMYYDHAAFAVNVLCSVLILGGTYLLLYLVSFGRWVGNGDWILGSICGLVLCDPWLAFIALFFANFFGSVVSYPILKRQKNKKVFFGPFLVAGFFVALFLMNFWDRLLIGL